MSVIEAGARIGWQELNALPPTSRIHNGNYQYLRKPNGKWMQLGYPGNNWSAIQVATSGYVTVQFVPFEVNVPEERDGETFESWEVRFVTAARRGAASHGVRNATLTDAFNRIGLDPSVAAGSEVIPLAPGARGWGRHSMGDAPNGSLFMMEDGSVYERNRPYWFKKAPSPSDRHVNMPDSGWTVVRWGQQGDLLSFDYRPAPATETDEANKAKLIRAKQAAWRVGMQLKSTHSWCGTLESILAEGGVTARDANGGVLNYDQQMRRDVGTVFVYQGQRDTNSWALMRRDAAARTQGGTVRIMGSYERNGAERLYQVWRPGTEWMGATFYAAATHEFLETLTEHAGLTIEVGETIYRVNAAGRFERIERRADNRYRAAPRATTLSTYTSTDFGSGGQAITFLYVPGLFE